MLSIVICGILAALCLLYFVILLILTGTMGAAVLWLLLSFVFLGGALYAAIRRRHPDRLVLPLWMKSALTACCLAVVVVITALEIVIWTSGEGYAPEDLDYLIVLGAEVNGWEPSDTLKQRLDTAAAYLEANPDTRVILSGGREQENTQVQALVMYRYLKSEGIKPSRMVMETQSSDTEQKLCYSLRLITASDSAAIVTSNYHICRSKALASAQGRANLYEIAAPEHVLLLPHQSVCECLALIYEKFMGKI